MNLSWPDTEITRNICQDQGAAALQDFFFLPMPNKGQNEPLCLWAGLQMWAVLIDKEKKNSFVMSWSEVIERFALQPWTKIVKYTVFGNEFSNKMKMFLIVPLPCKSLETLLVQQANVRSDHDLISKYRRLLEKCCPAQKLSTGLLDGYFSSLALGLSLTSVPENFHNINPTLIFYTLRIVAWTCAYEINCNPSLLLQITFTLLNFYYNI